MARIRVIEEPEATGNIKTAYEGLRRRMGVVPDVVKLFSLWPEVFELHLQLFEQVMLAETELPSTTKEMIAVVVSKTNSCSYCVAHHSDSLRRYGISDDVVRQLGDDFHQALLDDQTLQLLEYAEKVTQHAYQVTDEDVEKLRQWGWTDRQILEATVIAGQFNFVNRMVDALGAELEPTVPRSDRLVAETVT